MSLTACHTGRPTLERRPWWSNHLPTEWLARSTIVKPTHKLQNPTAGEPLVDFVRSGWMLRSRQLRDGRRQVLELLFPGDHLPARDAYAPDDLTALNGCEVVSVPGASVREARGRSPGLDALLTAGEERRAAIINERLVSLGQRTALERMAHLCCEVTCRLNGEELGRRCELPMVQADLADLLGLSTVHTNRTVQALRARSLVHLGRGWLQVLDHPGLAALADFSPDYLR